MYTTPPLTSLIWADGINREFYTVILPRHTMDYLKLRQRAMYVCGSLRRLVQLHPNHNVPVSLIYTVYMYARDYTILHT